jgi:hypothetical protein
MVLLNLMYMNNRYQFILVLWMLLSLLQACKKQEENQEPKEVNEQTMIVLNEGNFGWGNASVGLYDLQLKQYQSEVFKKKNNRPLGDVLQSALKTSHALYLVLNNSGSIEMVNPVTLASVQTFSDLGSPRFLCQIEQTNHAFLSDLYSNTIKRIDLLSGNVLASIPANGWTEQIFLFENKYWVSNLSNHLVYRLNNANQLEDSLLVQGALRSMKQNNQQAVFVLSDSNQYSYIWELTSNGLQYKTHTTTIINQWVVDDNGKAFCISNKELLQQSAGGVWEPLASVAQILNPYAMYVHNQKIWITDARDYVQKGKVWSFDLETKEMFSFDAGAIPNGFLFY